MKITMIYNTVYAFATQRNATQRNAYHNYILNNNFKFYIFQFFRTLEFLSGFSRFAKIISFIKEKQNICSFFYREKRTTPKADSRQKAPSFVKRSKAKARFQRTTPFRIRNSLVKTMSLRVKRSNLNLVKFDFYNLISLINKFYTKWIASGDAFAMTIKNKFEIISQSDYGFCYKNYFFNINQVFRNSYDFGERFGRNLNYDFEKNCSGGFGKNYFGDCNFGFDFGNEIYGIGHDLAGFLFNRKTKKINLCQRFSVGEGEQK